MICEENIPFIAGLIKLSLIERPFYFDRLMKKLSLIPVLLVGALLIYAAEDFPEWGSSSAPASASPLSSHFISNTGVDTEVPNMVTAVLADYRGFDTMFETVVVFIAGMAVLAILKNSSGPNSKKKNFHIIIRLA